MKKKCETENMKEVTPNSPNRTDKSNQSNIINSNTFLQQMYLDIKRHYYIKMIGNLSQMRPMKQNMVKFSHLVDRQVFLLKH